MSEALTFVLSDESINDRGFRIKTSGIDLKRFKKNPVMLWMHRRDNGFDLTQVLPIGKWENIRTEDGKLMADAVFDENDKFSMLIKNKVENKLIRGCSIGVNPIEFSTDENDLEKGQTRATITKCEVYEASIVDMPSNKNTVRLLSATDQDDVPLIQKPANMAGNDENKFSFKSESDLMAFMKEKFNLVPEAGNPDPDTGNGEENSEEFKFKSENSFLSWFKEKFGLQPKTKKPESNEDPQPGNHGSDDVEKLTSDLKQKNSEIETLNSKIDELNSQIETLKGSPGAEDPKPNNPTDGGGGSGEDDSLKTYSSAKETWDAVNSIFD